MNEFEKYMKCQFCNLVLDNPYESKCCGKLFCYKCIGNIETESCGQCFKIQEFRQNCFVKRILNQMSLSCFFKCGEKMHSSTLRKHMIYCPNREYRCHFCDEDNYYSDKVRHNQINFLGKKKDFLYHLIELHPDRVVEFHENLPKDEKFRKKYNFIKEEMKDNELVNNSNSVKSMNNSFSNSRFNKKIDKFLKEQSKPLVPRSQNYFSFLENMRILDIPGQQAQPANNVDIVNKSPNASIEYNQINAERNNSYHSGNSDNSNNHYDGFYNSIDKDKYKENEKENYNNTSNNSHNDNIPTIIQNVIDNNSRNNKFSWNVESKNEFDKDINNNNNNNSKANIISTSYRDLDIDLDCPNKNNLFSLNMEALQPKNSLTNLKFNNMDFGINNEEGAFQSTIKGSNYYNDIYKDEDNEFDYGHYKPYKYLYEESPFINFGEIKNHNEYIDMLKDKDKDKEKNIEKENKLKCEKNTIDEDNNYLTDSKVNILLPKISEILNKKSNDSNNKIISKENTANKSDDDLSYFSSICKTSKRLEELDMKKEQLELYSLIPDIDENLKRGFKYEEYLQSCKQEVNKNSLLTTDPTSVNISDRNIPNKNNDIKDSHNGFNKDNEPKDKVKMIVRHKKNLNEKNNK